MTDEQFKVFMVFLNQFEAHLQSIEDTMNQIRERLP